MLPQPPPDAPAPPPGEAAILSQRNFKWIITIGTVSMLLCLIWLSSPVVIRSHRNSGQTEATSNLRQIGLAIYEFEKEYGEYPGTSTAGEVRRRSGTKLGLNDRTSNELFTQLLASGVVGSESIFYCKAKHSKKPDNKFATTKTALAKGECAFAYIAGQSSAGNPARPLAFGPVIPGTMTLDAKTFDGKAVILKHDISVTSMPINSAGKIIYQGHDLLDPSHPIWGSTVPDIKWPK